MSQKRIYILLALATALLLAFAYRAQRAGPLTVQPVKAPFGLEGSQQLVSAPKSSPVLEDFSAKTQAKVEECLGARAGDFGELEALALKTAGKLKSDTLEWKVVQFDDEAGRPFRLRMDRESGSMKLSLFSVDEEGMPDRVSLNAGETLDSLLRGKRVNKELESHTLDYDSGYAVTVDKEDGVTQKYAVVGEKIRLACENTVDGPDCHCVR